MGGRLAFVLGGAVVAAGVAITSCQSQVFLQGGQPIGTTPTNTATGGQSQTSSTSTGQGGASSSSPSTTSPGQGGMGGSGGQSATIVFGVPIAAASPVDVAVDAKGNVVVVGVFESTVDFGAGQLVPKGADTFVLKLAPDGTLLWAKPWGDDKDELVAAVAVDAAGNIGITGRRVECTMGGPNGPECLEELFVAKLNDAGSTMWTHFTASQPLAQGNSGFRGGNDIDFDALGNLVVAATVGYQDDLGGGPLAGKGPFNAALAKFDPSGSDLWSKVFGDGWTKGASHVAIDGSGAIVLVVYSKGGVTDLGGGPIVNNGNIWDFLVARYAPDGVHLWSKNLGGNDFDTLFSFDVAPSGDFFITGQGKVDFGGGAVKSYVAGFDVQGQFQFSHDAMFARTLDVDASGNAFLHECQQKGPACIAGSNELGRITAMGYDWSVAPPQVLVPVAIAADGGGGVVSVGSFEGSVDLGNGSLPCPGASCMLVLHVTPP